MIMRIMSIPKKLMKKLCFLWINIKPMKKINLDVKLKEAMPEVQLLKLDISLINNQILLNHIFGLMKCLNIAT